jgi:hypothetical protein
MKKLDKATIAARDEINTRLQDKFGDLEKAVDDFNDKVSQAWAKVAEAVEYFNTELDEAWGNTLQPALEEYNEAVADANAWKQEVAGDIQAYIDERSDKWREGEACGRYEAWREPYDDEISSAEFERPDDLDLGDEPDQFDVSDVENASELLEQLPEEVEQ